MVQGRRPNTGRVKLEKPGGEYFLSSVQLWGLGGWEESRSSLLSVLQCKLGEGGREQEAKTGLSTVPCQLPAQHADMPNLGWTRDFAWDKPGPRSDPYPGIFGTG